MVTYARACLRTFLPDYSGPKDTRSLTKITSGNLLNVQKIKKTVTIQRNFRLASRRDASLGRKCDTIKYTRIPLGMRPRSSVGCIRYGMRRILMASLFLPSDAFLRNARHLHHCVPDILLNSYKKPGELRFSYKIIHSLPRVRSVNDAKFHKPIQHQFQKNRGKYLGDFALRRLVFLL